MQNLQQKSKSWVYFDRLIQAAIVKIDKIWPNKSNIDTLSFRNKK